MAFATRPFSTVQQQPGRLPTSFFVSTALARHLHVDLRNAGVGLAVVFASVPAVAVALDIAELPHLEASPFTIGRQLCACLSGVLISHNVGVAVIAPADGVRREVPNMALVDGRKTAFVQYGLSDYVVAHLFLIPAVMLLL